MAFFKIKILENICIFLKLYYNKIYIMSNNIYFTFDGDEADIVLGDDNYTSNYVMRIDNEEIYLKLGDNADEIDKDGDDIIELKDAFINIGDKLQHLTNNDINGVDGIIDGIDISCVNIDVGGKLDVSNSLIVPRRVIALM